MVTNKKMRQLIKKTKRYKKNVKLDITSKHLKELFDPPFKKVYDCVIITKKSSEHWETYFDAAIEMYGDKTGYEAFYNETRINDYFDNRLPVPVATKIAFMAMKIWALKLKELDPNSKFCIIICSLDKYVEIRFHKVRDDEVSWLGDDIESDKKTAVGYIYV